MIYIYIYIYIILLFQQVIHLHLKGGITLLVFQEIMSGNVCYEVFSSKLTTYTALPSIRIPPYFLDKYYIYIYIVFKRGIPLYIVIYSYNLLENHFLANISGRYFRKYWYTTMKYSFYVKLYYIIVFY